MINPMNLTDKRILVTGASSGIGRETSILLSKLGAHVIMIARRLPQLEETFTNLEGTDHKYYSYDLSDTNGIDEYIQKVISENGKLDGFVHSAGVDSSRPLKMLKPDYVDEVMRINFYSFIEIVRCITKKGNFNEGMSIVGVSSIASLQGNQSKTVYCASKAAMDAAVRCMAKELSSKKIRVNTVMPSLIKTPIFDTFLDQGLGSEDSKNVMARQYLGVGETIDVANTIAFLLSNASKFVTGTSIAVDGGRLSS